MRGQQSLFSSKFITESKQERTQQRPRNYYQPERNRALVARYYFHVEINRYRYDDCIKLLEGEFYLTEPRIIHVLSKNSERINDLIREEPAHKDLAERHPHFNWRPR